MRRRPLLWVTSSLLAAAMACTLAPGGPADPSELATQVAATLTAIAQAQPSDTPINPTPPSAATPSSAPPATASTEPSATPTPPPNGVSLNCDDTYQRVRLIDGGASGRTLVVDEWTGTDWQVAWQYEGGNPEIRALEDDAGAYAFGGCQQLLVVPLRYLGSGGILELYVYEWQNGAAVQVYSNDGEHGQWSIAGDRMHFEQALYLQGEPNCCPCNRQVSEHQWTGAAFVEVESEIVPTYTGTPPPVCQASMFAQSPRRG